MKKVSVELSILAILVIGVIAAGYIYRAMSERPTFTLQKVMVGNVTETVEATGTIVPQVSTVLSFQVAGRIAAINHSAGDSVKKGDILVSLDSSDANVLLKQANDQKAAATAAVEQATENFKGAQYKLDTLERDGTSKYYDKKVQEKTIAAASAAEDLQQALLASATSSVQYATLQLQKNYLLAPADGVIAEKNVEVGESVAMADPVMTLISQHDYKIEAYVSQMDVAQIKVGDTATVSIKSSGNGKDLTAKVTLIDPAETQQDGVSGYKVTFEFNSNDPSIRSGLSADVSIALGEKTGVAVVAKEDLVQKDGQNFVMVPDAQGKEILKQVQIGMAGKDSVEIVSGLQIGDSIFSLQTK